MGTDKRVAVIGAGAAGVAAALELRRGGAQVTLVESGAPGGNWLAADLLPSKVYLTAGNLLEHMARAAARNMVAGGPVGDPFPSVASWRREALDRAGRKLVEILSAAGVRLLLGRASLAGNRQLTVETGGGSVTLRPDAIVIATGSRPRRHPAFDYDGQRVFTTKDAFLGPSLPQGLLVVGSGPSGVEFAHLYNRFGTRVTLLISRDHLLPHEDPDVAAMVQEALATAGVTVVPRARVAALHVQPPGENGRVTAIVEDGRRFEADAALVAIGQVPNADGLGLENEGIEVDQRGRIPVDEYQRTPAPGIYAAGDVTGKFMLASVAARQGVVAANHIVGKPVVPVRYDVVTSSVFASPQVASVGMTAGWAKFKGVAVEVYQASFTTNLKAEVEDRAGGLIKVVAAAGTGRVLGGSIVGPEASELIATLAVAVRGGLTLPELRDTLFITPSFAETFSELELVKRGNH